MFIACPGLLSTPPSLHGTCGNLLVIGGYIKGQINAYSIPAVYYYSVVQIYPCLYVIQP